MMRDAAEGALDYLPRPTMPTCALLLLAPVVLGPVIALVALGLAIFGQARMQGSEAGDSVCGSCGYSTRGLQSFQCPECGSDLRRVGIVPVRRFAARGVSRWLVTLALLTIFCSLLGVAGLLVLLMM